MPLPVYLHRWNLLIMFFRLSDQGQGGWLLLFSMGRKNLNQSTAFNRSIDKQLFKLIKSALTKFNSRWHRCDSNPIMEDMDRISNSLRKSANIHNSSIELSSMHWESFRERQRIPYVYVFEQDGNTDCVIYIHGRMSTLVVIPEFNQDDFNTLSVGNSDTFTGFVRKTEYQKATFSKVRKAEWCRRLNFWKVEWLKRPSDLEGRIFEV